MTTTTIPPPFSTTSSRWSALLTRDPLASSSFIYSVLTTRIYCRPTCPSRMARRANILFHSNAAEAAAAGFRPCKRCRPEVSGVEADGQVLVVERACALIREEEGERGKGRWSVRDLAKEVGFTESHFCRVFKKVMGVTVGEYRKGLRLGVGDSVEDVVPTSDISPDAMSTFDDDPRLCTFPNELDSSALMSQDWLDFSSESTVQVRELGHLLPALDSVGLPSSYLEEALQTPPLCLDAVDDGFEFMDFESHLYLENLMF